MKQRVLTGCGIFAVIILALLFRGFNTIIFDGLIVALSLMCALEMNNILSKMGKYNNILFELLFAGIAPATLVLTIHLMLPVLYIILIQFGLAVLFVLLTFATSLILKNKTKRDIELRKLNISIFKYSIIKSLNTAICFIYPTMLIMLFIIINNISKFVSADIGNLALYLLVLTMIIPVFVDTFAMLTGSIFGGKKLCPKISPKKTISGAIGGLLWGVIGAVLVFVLFSAITQFDVVFNSLNIEIWHFAIVGFAGSILCQVGDLFESLLKRKAGIKDSGNSLPGHGGFLDRIDSHIFNIIAVLIYCIIVL